MSPTHPDVWPASSEAVIQRSSGALRLRCSSAGVEVDIQGLPNWFDALARLTAACSSSGCGHPVHRLAAGAGVSPTDVPA